MTIKVNKKRKSVVPYTSGGGFGSNEEGQPSSGPKRKRRKSNFSPCTHLNPNLFLSIAYTSETKPSDNVRVELKFNCQKRLEELYEGKAESFFPKSISEIKTVNGQKNTEAEEKIKTVVSKGKEESKDSGKLSNKRSKLQVTEEKENEEDDEGTSLIKKYMPLSYATKPKASEPRALEPPADEICEDSGERRRKQQQIVKNMILSYVNNASDKELSPKQSLSASTKSSTDKTDTAAPLVEKSVNNAVNPVVSSIGANEKPMNARLEQRLAEKTEPRIVDFTENSKSLKAEEIAPSTSKQKVQPKITVKPGIDNMMKEEKSLPSSSSKPTTTTFKFKFMDTNQPTKELSKGLKEPLTKKENSKSLVKGKVAEEVSTKSSLFSFGFSKEKSAMKNETDKLNETTLEDEAKNENLTKILYSSISKTDIEKIKQICQKFPNEYMVVSDDFKGLYKCDIMLYDGEAALPKAFKIAFSIVLGKKLVETQWIDDSSLENGFASLENYTCNITMDTRKNMFEKYRFYIDEELNDVPANNISSKEITLIIQAAGGTVKLFP